VIFDESYNFRRVIDYLLKKNLTNEYSGQFLRILN